MGNIGQITLSLGLLIRVPLIHTFNQVTASGGVGELTVLHTRLMSLSTWTNTSRSPPTICAAETGGKKGTITQHCLLTIALRMCPSLPFGSPPKGPCAGGGKIDPLFLLLFRLARTPATDEGCKSTPGKRRRKRKGEYCTVEQNCLLVFCSPDIVLLYYYTKMPFFLS